jgi:hypothetical protein
MVKKKKLKAGIEGIKLTLATALVTTGVAQINNGNTWVGAGIVAIGFIIYVAYVIETGGVVE